MNGSLTTEELKKAHPSRLERQRQGTVWSHTHVWRIKIQEGYLRSEKSQPHTRPHSPRFQWLEDKSPQLLAAKTNRGSVSGKLLESQAVSLKELTHGLSHSDSLPLSSSNRIAA